MKRFLTILMILLMFSGCGQKTEQVKVAANNESTKADNLENKVDNSSPESVIKAYYSLQGNPEDNNFKQCFYVQNKINGAFLKEKAKDFKIKQVKLDKIFKIDQKDNFAVVTCAYDTYFGEINKWRKGIDFIPMISKDNHWYILNDFNGLESKDTEKITEMMDNAQKQALEVTEVIDLNKEQMQFENDNKQFLLDCRKKLEEAVQNNKELIAK